MSDLIEKLTTNGTAATAQGKIKLNGTAATAQGEIIQTKVLAKVEVTTMIMSK